MVGPDTQLLCIDFDNTLVNGHMHQFMVQKSILQGSASEFVDDALTQFGSGNAKNGLKNPAENVALIREALQNGHAVAITSFTQFPEVVVPVLSKMGLTPTEISKIHIVGGFPDDNAIPDPNRSLPGGNGQPKITVLNGNKPSHPDCKEQHIQQAMQHAKVSHPGKVILIDDSETNCSKAEAVGHAAVRVPIAHNPDPSYLTGVHDKLNNKRSYKSLDEQISTAKNAQELAYVITGFNGEIKNSQGAVLDKNQMADNILRILNNDKIVADIVNEGLFPQEVRALQLTSSFGIYGKLMDLVKEKHLENEQKKQNEPIFIQQIQGANSVEGLIDIIRAYPGNMLASNGVPLNKDIVCKNLREFIDNPEYRKHIVAGNQMMWGGSEITSNYGLRNKFIELVKVRHEKEQALQETQQFEQDIKSAKNVNELISKLEAHNGLIITSTGQNISGQHIAAGMKNLLSQQGAIAHIATDDNVLWGNYAITRTHGIRDKFSELVKSQHQTELLAQAAAKPFPSEPEPIQSQSQAKHQQPKISRSHGLIKDLTEQDWKEAQQFFEVNQDKVKRDKKLLRAKCSFIKVGDQIYAIKTGNCVGEGNFGKVKIVQNRQGENFAVKIEGRGKRGDQDDETKIMGILGQFHGEAERNTYLKKFKGRSADQRLYTVMDLKEGTELAEELYVSKFEDTHKDLNETQKLLLAIKSAEAIQLLHDNRIIHADIKPENLMAKVNGEIIVVSAIDFGLSMILPEGQDIIYDIAKGTPGFIAPEIALFDKDNNCTYLTDPAPFSFASDIYALGRMYLDDFDLKMGRDFYDKILANDPKKRLDMPGLLDGLYKKLEQQPGLSETAKAMLREHKAQNAEPKALEKLKSMSKEALMDQYVNYANHPSHKTGHWLLNKHKDAGRFSFGKGKIREDQMNELSNAIQYLKSNDAKIEKVDQARYLYAILTKIENKIGQEWNTRDSGMLGLVQEQKKNLETQFSGLKNLSPEMIKSYELVNDSKTPAKSNKYK